VKFTLGRAEAAAIYLARAKVNKVDRLRRHASLFSLSPRASTTPAARQELPTPDSSFVAVCLPFCISFSISRFHLQELYRRRVIDLFPPTATTDHCPLHPSKIERGHESSCVPTGDLNA
jgi:hypothetical protein